MRVHLDAEETSILIVPPPPPKSGMLCENQAPPTQGQRYSQLEWTHIVFGDQDYSWS